MDAPSRADDAEAKPGPLRIGTRGSQLARAQTGQMIERIRGLGHAAEEVRIATRGDIRQDVPIARIGDDGVFVRELERSLLEHRIDAAVHSLKDLPTATTPGLDLVCIPERAVPFDVLVSRDGGGLRELPPGATVGTASIRRRVQVQALRPDLTIVPIRGNVDSRLGRVDDGSLDAVMLAAAGLSRLGHGERISEILQPPDFWPAVAQGALVIQIRADDDRMRQLLKPLDHPATHLAAVAERALLAALAGGCLAPIGSWGRFESDGQLHLGGRVLAIEHAAVSSVTAAASAQVDTVEAAALLGRQVASALLDQGAGPMLELMRHGIPDETEGERG